MAPKFAGKHTIYTYEVKDLEGEPVSLDRYKGKVLLVVNTASGCGFTGQYRELEELYKLYRDQGFEILAFPSNDFGKQEPLNGSEIDEFCAQQFRTTFPVFDKVHVKGKQAIPLYRFLSRKELNGQLNSRPRWNFHKYLVNRHGEVVDYFYPFTGPTSAAIKKAIEKLLA